METSSQTGYANSGFGMYAGIPAASFSTFAPAEASFLAALSVRDAIERSAHVFEVRLKQDAVLAAIEGLRREKEDSEKTLLQLEIARLRNDKDNSVLVQILEAVKKA